MTYRTSRVVLFGDCDPAGIVYTPRIAHFVIEAALDFLSHALEGPAARRLLAMGILPPARSLAIEFLHPMTWDEVIEIEVAVKEVRDHSFSLLVISLNDAHHFTFRATLGQVCVSPESRRPVLLPAELRAALGRVTDGGEVR